MNTLEATCHLNLYHMAEQPPNVEYALNSFHECCGMRHHQSTVTDCISSSTTSLLSSAIHVGSPEYCSHSALFEAVGTITGDFVSFPVDELILGGQSRKRKTTTTKSTRSSMRSNWRGPHHTMATYRSSGNVVGSSGGDDIELVLGSTPRSKGKQPSRVSTSVPCHPCPECQKMFGSPGKLQQHMFVHTGERPFKCSECEKGFSSRFKLMRHALIHSNDRRYKCSFCDRCFHRKDHLKNHLQVHNPNKKTYKCEQCEKEYNSRLSFRKHVAVHAAVAGDLECKVCSKRFASTDEIMYHLKVHTGSRTIKSPNEKKFKCDFCERRFFTRKDVKRHLVVHTGRRDFLCQFCPQRFGRKDHLVRHIKKSHLLSAKVKDGGGDGGLTVTCHEQNITPACAASYHYECLPSTSQSFASLSPSDFLHIPSSGHHQHVNRDVKQPPHGFTATSSSVTASTSSTACLMSSSSSSPFSHDFKLYDEIKTEREDDDPMDAASPLDISQLLGFLPLAPPPPATTLSSSLGISSPSSAVSSTYMTPEYVMTSLGQVPVSTTSLPQFNQAFQ